MYSSSSSSRKSSKKAALERLRNNRRKRDLGELDAEEDVLDGGNYREEEDVYDVVNEDEYQNLVESRRQREDFVVDDGECVSCLGLGGIFRALSRSNFFAFVLIIVSLFPPSQDGLGYYDDGEERLGDEDNHPGNKKKRSGNTNLKRATTPKTAAQSTPWVKRIS